MATQTQTGSGVQQLHHRVHRSLTFAEYNQTSHMLLWDTPPALYHTLTHEQHTHIHTYTNV